MPFDDTSSAREKFTFVLPAAFMAPPPPAKFSVLRRHALHWGALSAGLTLMFGVLMATKLGHFRNEETCTFAAALILAVWVCSGMLRQDRSVFGWGATFCLLPVVMIECSWVPMPRDGVALVVETVCVALLFAGNLRRLGAEMGDSLAKALNRERSCLAAS